MRTRFTRTELGERAFETGVLAMGTKATKAVLLGAAAAAALIVWTVGIRRLDSIWFSIEDVGASIMALTTAEKQALGLPEAPPWIGHYLPRAA